MRVITSFLAASVFLATPAFAETSRFLAGVAWEPTRDWQLYAYYGQEQVDKKSWVDTATGNGYGYGNELYNNSGAPCSAAR